MSNNDLRNRVYRRMSEIDTRVEQGEILPSDHNTMKFLSRILSDMESEPSSAFGLVRERGLVGLVDDAVIRDPVGVKLYEFGWQGKLPNYVKEDVFIKSSREKWDKLGESGKAAFKRIWVFVSDDEACNFLTRASEEDLFRFYVDVNVISDEKFEALNALFRMANRKMNESEYMSWMHKFGINLQYNP